MLWSARMHDLDTQQRFVQLRVQGWSFDRIAAELKVSRQTLINWSRKFQFEIRNLQAIERESLQQTLLASQTARLQVLGDQLKQIEAELRQRPISDLSTVSLFNLAQRLRREILAATGTPTFSLPAGEIPTAEYFDLVQDWSV
jgi:transposase